MKPDTKSAARRWLPHAITAIVLLTVIVSRVLIEGARELSAGQNALARGDVLEAVRHLRRAAHWYLPGSPYTARAYETLETIARQAEAHGRNDHAFAAWRAIRASALATRWIITPEQARLERANQHLAALLAEMPPPPEDRNKDRSRLREEHLALLTHHHAPDPAWLLIMSCGFALWLGAAWWGARHAWDEDDKVRPRPMALAATMFILGLSLFLVAIARA